MAKGQALCQGLEKTPIWENSIQPQQIDHAPTAPNIHLHPSRCPACCSTLLLSVAILSTAQPPIHPVCGYGKWPPATYWSIHVASYGTLPQLAPTGPSQRSISADQLLDFVHILGRSLDASLHLDPILARMPVWKRGTPVNRRIIMFHTKWPKVGGTPFSSTLVIYLGVFLQNQPKSFTVDWNPLKSRTVHQYSSICSANPHL